MPGEPGIAGQSVSICDNSSCTAIDTETTDGNGNFSLFVPWATNFADGAGDPDDDAGRLLPHQLQPRERSRFSGQIFPAGT